MGIEPREALVLPSFKKLKNQTEISKKDIINFMKKYAQSYIAPQSSNGIKKICKKLPAISNKW